MTQHNIIGFYLTLAILNGGILFAVALVFSASAVIAFSIGGTAAVTSFALLCLICLPGAIHELPLDIERIA